MIELLFFIMLGIEQPITMPSRLELMGEQYVGFVNVNSGIEVANMISIDGETKTYVFQADSNTISCIPAFWPLYSEYLFYAKINYKLLEIGFEHLCIHNSDDWYWRVKELTGFNRVYIKIGTNSK